MTTERLSSFRWRSLAGTLASTLLLFLYARGGPFWVLGFVALVPWLLALTAASTLKRAVLLGLLMSFAFVAAVFGWFGAAIGSYLGIGSLPASLVWILLAPAMQPQWIAFAMARHLAGLRHGPVVRAAAGACAWVACEWIVPKLLGDTLGHGLHPSATLRQVADLGGAPGLTLLLLLVNECVAATVGAWSAGTRAWLRPLVLGAALLGGMAGYGSWRLAVLHAMPQDDAPALRIAMIQASITDYERLRREMGAYAVVRHVLDTHYALSWSAIRDHGADALLWSETVYPTTFGRPRSPDGAAFDREIQGFVDAAGVPLVFGTYDRDAAGEYNTADFLEPGRGLLGVYRKAHPFPLTEYVPQWLDTPWFRRLLPWAGTWQPGDGARVLPLRTRDGREVSVVPLICLDDVRPDLAIEGARLEAQAIVGMSNDSWFTDHPIGARLHLAVAAFRSIETRLPQVRVTTNGLSAIVDDTGEVLATTQMGQQAVLTAFVSARPPPRTLMVRWGDWVGRAGAGFLLALATSSAWRALRARTARVRSEPALLEVVVLGSRWRMVLAVLRVAAVLGLASLAWDMQRRLGWQVQSLSQLWQFGLMVVLPMIVIWAIEHALRAQARVEGTTLVLDQARQRIEIPLAAITAVRAWRCPLPRSGVDVDTSSGPRSWGWAVARPQALSHMLTAAGAVLQPPGPRQAAWARFADARADARRSWLDAAPVKFLLFPLLPALVAFRLHQVIAFGGTFGEYLTFGPRAYFSGLLIWWASWALGLMLFAALLRILVEIASGLALLIRPGRLSEVRDAAEGLVRLVFYLGVPLWLILRLSPSG